MNLNSNLQNLILDKKPKKELEKHKSNFYLKKIESRHLNRNPILNSSIKNKTEIDLNKFVCFDGNSYQHSSLLSNSNLNLNPLVETAIQLIKNPNLKPEESYLNKFFRTFQPITYGELYNLNPKNKIYKLNVTNFFRPWLHPKPTNIFKFGLYGPKDITAVEHRMIRLKNIITNINKYGYIPSNDDMIEGYLLIKDQKDYRFLITAGHHRVAVLMALYLTNPNSNKNKIEVKFDKNRVKIEKVLESEIDNWPSVKSKYLNKIDSLEIFNHFFN